MLVSPVDLKIKTISEESNKGVFSFDPLPKGFGHTLGSVLRRVLLTSVKGAAITQVKLSGVGHQFSTVAGVKEDAVELSLNFKDLRFKNHTDQPVIATIEKKGPGKVTASDIECSSDLEVINKNTHIATLADAKTEFKAEITVATGYGYSPVEEREGSKIGVILLDALYSPVLRVMYNVVPTRFGKKTDLDKLVLTVETDGSVMPKDAVTESTELLGRFFDRLTAWDHVSEIIVEEDADADEQDEVGEEEVSVDELPLPTRTINALRKAGIETFSELKKKSEDELADIKNLGEKSVIEIRKLLLSEEKNN